MFYLSGRQQSGKYGVVDSVDFVEDFLTVNQLIIAESYGYKIQGFFREGDNFYFFPMTPVSANLLRKKPPVSMKIRLSVGLGFVQVIYIGHRIRAGVLEFLFFDDSGSDGMCIVPSSKFVSREITVDYVNIDKKRAKVLMIRYKDSGGFAI